MNRFDSAYSSRPRSSGRWLQALVLTALVALGLLSSSVVRAQYTVNMAATVNPMCATGTTQLSATLGGGPIAGGYGAAGVAYAAPYAAAGNEVYLNLDDDEVSGQQFVNEVFRFYGSDIDLNANGFWIGSNGFITFRNDVNATQIVPRNLAAPGLGQTYHTIYIANADMSPQLGGDIWYEVQNDGLGDVLLITYDGVPLYNSANPLVNSGLLVDVQAVLYLNGHPNAGRIEIRVDLFPDNNIPAAPANKQTVTIGALNNCQPPINNGALGLDQNNPGADIDDVTYSFDPGLPNIIAASVAFYHCGTTACTTGGTLLGTDGSAPFTQNWNAPPSTTNSTHYFRSEMTLTNCNVIASTSFAVTVNANPTTPIALTGNQNVCVGGSVSYSVTPTIAGSTISWSTTAPGASIIVSGAQNENATITYPGGGSNAGSSYQIQVTETGPAPTFCTGVSTFNNRVTIFNVPTGPLNAAPDPICAVATGSNFSTFSLPAGYGSYTWSFVTNTIGATFGAGTNSRNVNVTASPVQPAAAATVTVQVIAANGPGGLCSQTFTRSITVNPIPPARTLTQTAPATCVNQNHAYTLSGVAEAGNTVAFSASGVAYTWQGGYVNGTFGAALTRTIQWNGAGTGTVNVTEQTAAGCIRTYSINTTVNALPTPIVNGANTPCQYVAPSAGPPQYQTAPNPIEYPYITFSPAGNGFRWVVSAGGSIVAANAATTNALPNTATAPGGTVNGGTYNTGVTGITVRWTGTGAQTVTLLEQTTAGCQALVVYNVNVTATPTAAAFSITGATTVCASPGPGNVVAYSTTGADNHTISVVGGTVTAVTAPYVITGGGSGAQGVGAVANAFTVTWGAAGTGFISDEYTVSGCAAVETYTVTINPLPTFQITGPPAPLCGSTIHTFAVANLVNGGGAPNYNWSEAGDPDNIGTLGANGSSTINVTFINPPGATSNYTIQCVVTNTNTGCSQTVSQLFVINQVPAAPVIAAVPTSCASSPANPASQTTWAGITSVAGSLNASLTNAPPGSTVTSPVATGGAANVTATWGQLGQNPALAPQSVVVTLNVSVTGANGCVSPIANSNTTLYARPAPAPLQALPPLCVNTPVPINVAVATNSGLGQPNVNYTWAASGVTLAGPGPGLNNQITALGAAGAKSITVTATDLTSGCVTQTVTNFTVAPIPTPVISGPTSACQDTTDPLGKPHGGPFGFTYEYVTNLVAGNTYAWTVSNGYVDAYSTNNGVTWTNLPGNVVLANVSTAPIVDAHRIRVVFYGSSPGKVKVTETHPGGCAFTTLDYNVNLNTRPDIQTLTVSTDICAGDNGTASIAVSQVGYDYRVELSADGGTTWTPATIIGTAVQAGTGGTLNWTINASSLPYAPAIPPNTKDFVVRVTARQLAPFNGCGWYIASNLENLYVNPKPAANIPVSIALSPRVCTGEGITIEVGTVGIPSQSWVSYQAEIRQIRDYAGAPIVPTPWAAFGTPVVGSGIGAISLTGNAPAGASPLLDDQNYEYRVIAITDMSFAPPPNIACTTELAQTVQNRVFALPTDPGVTFAPNPVCWEENVTVNLANTQNGVQYEVNIGGTSLSPAVIIDGNGGAANAVINSAEFYATNPIGMGSVFVNNVQVTARIAIYGIYTRPIPPSACATDYGTTNLEVLEKPVATITGPDTVCAATMSQYDAGYSTPYPNTWDWQLLSSPDAPPANTTPLQALNSGWWTVNPYVVTWGESYLTCDGTYNPITTTLRMIITNANNCTDTAFKTIVINPTVNDAVISGDPTACIYGGFEQHLETYSVARPGNCVFPAGTTFLWSLPAVGNPVSGAIRSGQGTTSIVGEWITTSGTGIGQVTCTITLPATHGGCVTVKTLNVNVYPLPQPVISGPANVCQGQTGVVYTADLYPNDTYLWEVLGGTIVSGTGTGVPGDLGTRSGIGLNTITINWLNAANPNAYVRLTQTSVAGCMNKTTYNVTVHPTPVPVINGPGIVCDNSVVQYSTANNAPNNVYTWTITGNASIQSGANQATVNVLTGAVGSGTSFTLTLNERVLATGCQTTVNRVINIVAKPQPTITRISPLPGQVGGACFGEEVEYGNTDLVAGNPSYSYQWTVSNGVINPLTPATGATIKVTWNTVGTGTLTLAKWHTGSQCTTVVSQSINITNKPTPAIAGPNTVCGGDQFTYTTAFNAGNTYSWSVAGATLVSGNTSNSAIVKFPNPANLTPVNATVTVTETNTLSGCFGSTSLVVTVNYMPQATTINGLSTVCNNATTNYNVTGEPAGLTFNWSVTGGAIVSGTGTSSINVEWSAVGNQTITLTMKNGITSCEKTISRVVTVEFQPAPSISGDATVCTGEQIAYSTPANAGSTYSWSVTGGTIVSGNTSPNITVLWTTAGNQTVSVTETNASGNCSASRTLNVTVGQTPVATAITRLSPAGNVSQACENDLITYGTNLSSVGSVTYEWTTTGGIFTSATNASTATVRWTSQGNQTLKVKITAAGTDCSTTLTQNVTVTYKPAPNINGAVVACINKDHVYQTPYVAGSSYQWVITPSNVFAPITGYPNSNVIEVKWIQPGLHTVTVTETNIAGGCATTVSMNVQVNLIPTPFITSTTGYGNPPGRRPGIVCNFSSHTYTTVATPGNTFIWTVTGGNITGGQYTNTISVAWGPAGIGTIAVEETIPGSDCITTKLDTIDIRPTPTPVISGTNINPCAGSVQTYSTPFVQGNSYYWDVPVGGTILSGQNSNQITVRWDANTPAVTWPNTQATSLKVTEWVTDVLPLAGRPAPYAAVTSCWGEDGQSITIRPIPPTPVITGSAVVCASDLSDDPQTVNIYTYTSSVPVQNASAQGTISYAWSTTSNGVIVGSSTGTSVQIWWSNTGLTQTNGTIFLTHTSSWGCSSSSTYGVTINPLPNPVIEGPASVCQNSLQTYKVTGVPGNTYSWAVTGGNIIRAGQNTPSVTVEWTLPGSYTLTVTETNTFGCTVLNNRYVTVNALPEANITASGPTTFCQGGDVTLSAPMGYASYVWSTGETARSIVVRTTGQYWVKVTDANGCSNNSDTITVNVFPNTLPIITVSGPTTFCEGGSVTLTAPSGFSAYLWSTGATTQSITVTESGSYTVTIADGNGCTGTSTDVDVFVNPKPAPILTVVGTTTICSGDSVEVRAPAGYVSYTWISEQGVNYGTTRSIWVLQSDKISVQVVDANGCVGESDTVEITVAPVVAPVIAANGPTTFCDGNSVMLSAPAGFATYYWSNGATTREIVVADGGNYSVTVTNSAACESVSAPTEVVVNPLPARPGITRTGDTLKAMSNQAETFQWFRNGVMIPGAVDRNLVVSLPGTYRVEIADNNTCSAKSDGFDVILTDVDEDVVAGHGAELRVFPNPTTGQFTIETVMAEAGNVKIELVNTVGETVMTLNELSNGGSFSTNVEMGTLATGVYNVVVTTNNERWTVRLVRQ